jgi:hypothetical protein
LILELSVFLIAILLTGLCSILEVGWVEGVIKNNALRTALIDAGISAVYLVGLYFAFAEKYPIALPGMVIGGSLGVYIGVKMKERNEK